MEVILLLILIALIITFTSNLGDDTGAMDLAITEPNIDDEFEDDGYFEF